MAIVKSFECRRKMNQDTSARKTFRLLIGVTPNCFLTDTYNKISVSEVTLKIASQKNEKIKLIKINVIFVH